MEKQIEKEPLGKQVQHAEHEGRMVLPGIQALFGFQLIAVFNQTFHDHLSQTDKYVHLSAIIFTAISALLIMTPAAYHRQKEKEIISLKFVNISSKLICYAMVFLCLSICIDIDIISRMLQVHTYLSHFISFCLFSFYLFAWFMYPFLAKSA